MTDHPLRPATHQSLGEPLPHQQANGTRAHLKAIAFKKRPSFSARTRRTVWSYPVLAPVSRSCPRPKGRLPTRYSPVRRCTRSPKRTFSHDLHVLSTPPAFVLSQDQTLQFEPQLPSELTSQITHYSVFKEQTNYPNTATQIPASGSTPRVPFITRRKAPQTSRLR